MRIKYTLTILLSALSIIFISCNDETIISDPGVKLSFSTDTLMFDTVFTEIGSTTKRFTVHNTANGPISIERIYLAGGQSSQFRLNIDGIKENSVTNLEIKSNDSLFIFVEVTVDPVNSNSPMVVQDSIVFITNGNYQDVDLVAFGQNYHLFNKQIINTQTWINDKPYLIYNYVAVDSAQTLYIEQGCQIHFHYNSALYVLGSLNVSGSVENPVVFQGDRLEELYKDVPGQWGYIHLLPGSSNNEIDHAIIKNSIIGLQVDTFLNDSPTLKISNTKIENINAVGIFAQGARIQADNCVISNCGQYALALTIGGDYQFYHCTIGNYWAYSNRVTPSLLLNNWYEDINGNIQIRPIDKAFFGNCIIYGGSKSEIGLDEYLYSPNLINYTFENCILKVDPEMEMPSQRYIGCLINTNPSFMSTFENILELDTLSAAKDAGNPATALYYPFDINGNSRISDQGPDIGAYERIE